MRLMNAEFKKLFISNKMLLLFVAVIILSLFTRLGANVYPVFSDESNQQFYKSFMEKLSGEYTDEKGHLVADLQAEYNNISTSFSQLEKEYSEGEITSEEYMKRLSELSELSSQGNVVEYLASCDKYVREDTVNHYFVDYTGWGQLFQTYGFDFLLLIFTLIISVVSIAVEQNSDMITINSVCVKGRRTLGKSKVLVVLSSVAVVTVIVGIIHYVVYASKYNLFGFDYPLQSVKSFSGATKNLTLGQAYIALVITKIVGYCSFSAFAMFFAVLFKKAVPAMTFSLATVLVPMYILNSSTEGQLRYLLPMPVGAMMSTGYINGTQKMDIGKEYIFREVSTPQMIIVFSILILVSFLMLAFTSRRLSGKRFYVPHLKKPMFAVLSTVMIFSLCSCSSGVDFEEASDNYIIIADTNLIYSKSEKMIISVDELPTDTPNTVGFISGDTAVIKNKNTVSLLDLKTFDKSEIAVLGKNYELDGFLGMEDLVPSLSGVSIDLTAQNLENLVGGYENKLYFSSRNGITSYNVSDGTSEKLIDGKNILNFQIKNGNAFYINSGKLMKMNLKSKKEELLSENNTEAFAVGNEDIYYINLLDNSYVYSVNDNKTIFEKPCSSICFNGNTLVCVTDEGVYLVCEKGAKKIKETENEIFITADEENIYFLDNSETAVLNVYDYNGSYFSVDLYDY